MDDPVDRECDLFTCEFQVCPYQQCLSNLEHGRHQVELRLDIAPIRGLIENVLHGRATKQLGTYITLQCPKLVSMNVVGLRHKR